MQIQNRDPQKHEAAMLNIRNKHSIIIIIITNMM